MGENCCNYALGHILARQVTETAVSNLQVLPAHGQGAIADAQEVAAAGRDQAAEFRCGEHRLAGDTVPAPSGGDAGCCGYGSGQIGGDDRRPGGQRRT